MLIDPNTPFFRPLWVRVLCVVVPLIWAGVEFTQNNSPFWTSIFAAAGLYLAFELFIRRKSE